MTPPTKTWLTGVGIFLGYIMVALGVVTALKFQGPKMWWVIIALAVLGLISSAVWLWFSREDLKKPTAGTPASGIDATIAAARVQLASSKHVANPKFGSIPIVLVLGPSGSTKTTTVIRSGLEPELLAGDVYRGETVAPTSGVNLWYTQNSVVVEAGGPLLKDAPTWQRLVRALRPRSIRSALTGRAQSPRLALVCFGCDEFYKPGSGEAVPIAARDIRARLGEAAKQFGVQLPTYVMFTKLDAVANFEAFMRNFSAEEAREPLGAAITPDEGGAGTYADRVTPQLEHAFSELYTSLAERRLQTLGREHAPEVKPGAYEFPREFNKLRPLAVDFLREIGRPSELAVSPMLRGFYFTGVQAVFVSDATTPDYQPAAVQQAQVAGVRSATAVFGALGGAAPAAPVATPHGGGARKVPRWDFLPRVMREVIFGDEAAVRLTSAGARVNFWRRLGLGTVAVVALLLMVTFAYSYSRNKKLQDESLAAAAGIAQLPAVSVDLPTVDALQKLEVLRNKLDTLSDYEHTGAPLGLRWGLYHGSDLYGEVRKAYFAGFNKLMFAGTRNSMLAGLRALPDTARPTDDYGNTYSLLKAYLITTQNRDKATNDFLVPALTTRWLGGRAVDSTRVQLGRRQFDTYTTELKYSNPFPEAPDAAAVARARSFLRTFAGSQSIYQYMLAEAAKTNQPVQFNRKFPGTAEYLVDSYEVPGAFTKGGSVFMLNAFKTVDQYISGEAWVVGDERANVDKAKLVADLTSRYSNDFIAHWKRYLSSASVQRYSNVKDAATKLAAMSGNQSPLLELFSIASQNTAVGLPEVIRIFQPVQVMAATAPTDKLINEKNGPYINALATLQASVDKVPGAAPGVAEAATSAAINDAGTARGAARQIANGFNIDNAVQVHTLVQNLMEAPITNVEGLLKTFGASEINGKGRSFCAQARGILAKFPFASDATQQATLAEVASVLKPGTGSLWRFYDEALAATVPRQGNTFTPNPAGSVKVSPAFVAFLGRAAAWTDVMFKDNSPEPHLSVKVAPVRGEFTSVSVSLDGELIRSRAGGSDETAIVSWPGIQHEAKLSAAATAASGEVPYITLGGQWAVLQLFAAADDWKEIPNGYRAGWELTTRAQRQAAGPQVPKITVDVTSTSTPPAPQSLYVLRKGSLGGFDCGGDIAR